MSQPAWYWHRLRAMSPTEVVLHARKKLRQFRDARCRCDWQGWDFPEAGTFPPLPAPEKAPEILRAALRRDAEDILAGRWKAFGHLELRVDDPPRWQKDYLAARDLTTRESAFKLNHRRLPGGADVKLIWELSRWHHLVRLAMAAYVLNDERAARKCMDWLEDWARENPAYQGWNWTSALEVGMRLIQFTWIDALLSNARAPTAMSPPAPPPLDDNMRTRLSALRQNILGPHAWHAWRHRSFGSSANNHLLGELAGLIVAIARYPALTRCSTSLDRLQRLWEHEVLKQFAEDGGNKEQALNYHLFSWEFCWQTRMALRMAGREPASGVEERLQRAARFFWEVQSRTEAWDYGDSDDGFVTPFFVSATTRLREWREWIGRYAPSPGLEFWLGSSPEVGHRLGTDDPLHTIRTKDWWIFPQSGIALSESGFWWLRWDVSPLGYGRTAAHGHLDALHLSIWYRGVPVVIDPGTGAYYHDQKLRAWLASRSAHNSPSPDADELPKRLGPFLWSHHHPPPEVHVGNGSEAAVIAASVQLPGGTLRRTITRLDDNDGWEVADEFLAKNGMPRPFSVHWQFAPGSFVKVLEDRRFAVNRDGVSVVLQASAAWDEVALIEDQSAGVLSAKATHGLEADFAGCVSPAFRRVEWAPFVKLLARPQPDKPCVFRTTFLASPHS